MSNDPNPSSDVHVLHTTPFGVAVAAALLPALQAARTRTTMRRLTRGRPPVEDDVRPHSTVVLVLGHQTPALERAVDEIVQERQAHLVPVVAEQSVVRIGPVLGPSARATIDCYYRRLAQHAPQLAHQEVLDAFDARWPLDDLGYLPSAAIAAATITAGVVSRLSAGSNRDVQQLTMFDRHSSEIGTRRLTGVHGNARSRPPVAERDRSWAVLASHVRTLLAAAPDVPNEQESAFASLVGVTS